MNVSPEWWKDFFQGLTVEVWLAAAGEEQTRAEADCIEKLLVVPRGAKLLDVPCGAGRHSIELAARGYELTGVDISEDSIHEAKARSAERGLKVTCENRDMRDLPWRGAFDGAICFGNSFGFFDDAGDRAFLDAVARTLKPGAKFVMDTKAAESIFPHFQERPWMELGDVMFLENQQYDPARGRMDTEYTFIKKTKTERRTGSERVYTYRQLVELLAQAGFEKTEGYGSVTLEPFKLGSHRLLLATRRTG